MNRRTFVAWLSAVAGGIAVTLAAIPFLQYLRPSARAKVTGDPMTVDLSGLTPGEQMTFLWRGMPIWILRRTAEMLEALPGMTPYLIDSVSDDPEFHPPYFDKGLRSIKPEYLVLQGVCTHLACVPNPLPNKGDPAVGAWWQGGFFCPCHGSAYDYAGRVVKGPAPRNLRVPRHRFVSENVVVIGEDSHSAST